MKQLHGGKTQFPIPRLSPRIWLAIIVLVVVAISTGLVFTFSKSPDAEQFTMTPPTHDVLKRLQQNACGPGYSTATRYDVSQMPTYICNFLPNNSKTQLRDGQIMKDATGKCTVVTATTPLIRDRLCIHDPPTPNVTFTKKFNSRLSVNDYDYLNIPQSECALFCQRSPSCRGGYVTDKNKVINGVPYGCWIKGETVTSTSFKPSAVRDSWLRTPYGNCSNVPAFATCKNTGNPQIRIADSSNVNGVMLQQGSTFLREGSSLRFFPSGEDPLKLRERAQFAWNTQPSQIDCLSYTDPVGGCSLGSSVTIQDTFPKIDYNSNKCPWTYNASYPQYVQCTDRTNWSDLNVAYQVQSAGLKPLSKPDDIPANQSQFVQKVVCNSFKVKSAAKDAVGPCEIARMVPPAPPARPPVEPPKPKPVQMPSPQSIASPTVATKPSASPVGSTLAGLQASSVATKK